MLKTQSGIFWKRTKGSATCQSKPTKNWFKSASDMTMTYQYLCRTN